MPPKPVIAKPVQRPPAKKKPPVHKLPDPIREGEVLCDIQKRQWRLGKSIGVGGFGEIYAASDCVDKAVSVADAPYVIKIEPHSNGPLFVEMNFYIRVAKSDLIDQWMQTKKLKFLGMPRFVGSGSHEYRGEKYRFMVMQRFGTDIQKLFDAAKRQFPLHTVLTLALRIIDVLEYIHDKEYVHADIKGSNLLLGFGKGAESQVWLVDFGLACKYTVGGTHKEYKPDLRKAHNGTIEFTSRDAHIGANSRRGDFEILAYNLMQWVCGRLPWEDNLTDPEYVASQKNKYMSNIPLLVKQCFPNKNAPGVIVKFFEMVASLKFEEEPDYEKFRQLLRRALKESGHPENGALEFPSLGKTSARASAASSPAKKRTLPSEQVTFDESENKAGHAKQQKAKSSLHLKKSREPCSPKVSNRPSRQANLTPTTSPEGSSSEASSSAGKKRSASNHKEAPARKKSAPSSKLDESLSNPTPAMLAILARMKTKELQPSSPAPPAKKKQARLDSRSCSPVDLDTSSILTPAMEEVIRVREVRKSMEQSAHFFTPACSPMVGNDSDVGGSSRLVSSHRLPASTPADRDLYMTLDLSSAVEDEKDDSNEETDPVRKKSLGRSKGAKAAPALGRRGLRNRVQAITLDSTATSLDSSTASESMPTLDTQGRVIHKRKYKVVTMTSASTQTSPGVLRMPSISGRTGPYSLRSNVQSPTTPTRSASRLKAPPTVVDLSPDMFRETSDDSP